MNEIIKLLRDLIIVVIIVLPIREFIGLPFQISGHSMEDSYHDGEVIINNRFSFLPFIGDPIRGDVVVIRPKIYDDGKYLIKRVIGLPGDTIQFDGAGSVYLKKSGQASFVKLNESSYLSEYNNGRTFLPLDVEEKEFVIPENSYFVIGDNRTQSGDSRSCFIGCLFPGATHFVSRDEIDGKFFLSLGYFPILGKEGVFHTLKFQWKLPPRFFDTPSTHNYPELENVSAAS